MRLDTGSSRTSSWRGSSDGARCVSVLLRRTIAACLALAAVVGLGLGLGGCEALWSSFTDPNAGNCVINPGLCTASQVCSARTKRCEPAPETADDGGVPTEDGDGGGSSGGDGGGAYMVDMAQVSFPAKLPSCQRFGFCLHTPMTPGTLRGVYASSGTSAWAAGGDVILRWDGTRWSRVNDAGGYTNLVDLVKSATSIDVFALSRTGALYRWNGTQLTRVADVASGGANLKRLWAYAPDQIWAVGDGGAIYFWNGARWTIEASMTTRHLRGVWGLNPTTMWAVGENGTVLRRSGTGWAVMPGPSTNLALNGVWGTAASNLIAVGDQGSAFGFDGTTWIAESANAANGDLQAISGSDANTIFAVASNGTALSRSPARMWTSLVSPTARGLFGVSSIGGGDLFAVGDVGVRVNRASGAWRISDDDALPRPVGIAGEAGGRFFTVGTPQLMRAIGEWTSTAAAWTGQNSLAANITLRAVSFRASNDAMAVGDTGTCVRWQGTSWGSCSSGLAGNLYGVWFDPMNVSNGVAAGQNGVVSRWNGASWNPFTNNQTQTLYGITGVVMAGGDAWAVGTGGIIQYCSGAMCSVEVTSGVKPTLRGIFAFSTSEMYVVGDNGTILRRNLAMMPPWETLTSPTTLNLYAVWGTMSPSKTLYAVGAGGVVLRSTNGTMWTQISSDVTADLIGVAGVDASNAWAISAASWLRFVP